MCPQWLMRRLRTRLNFSAYYLWRACLSPGMRSWWWLAVVPASSARQKFPKSFFLKVVLIFGTVAVISAYSGSTDADRRDDNDYNPHPAVYRAGPNIPYIQTGWRAWLAHTPEMNPCQRGRTQCLAQRGKKDIRMTAQVRAREIGSKLRAGETGLQSNIKHSEHIYFVPLFSHFFRSFSVRSFDI